MNLRALRVFKTVCETKNMTAAGQKLHMTQPAVSQTIINLENNLNVKLFERIKNGLELTYSGEVLFNYSQKIIRLLSESEEVIKQISNLKKGRLRIGASMTIGTYLLPYIINEFKNKYQELKMPLVIDNTDHIVAKILENDLDIGFVEGPFSSAEIISEFFIKDELCLVASPDYFSVNNKNIKLEDLDKEKFILREQGSGTRDIALNKLEALNIKYNIKHVLNNFEAIKKAVAANMGVSILPKLAIEREVETGELVKINIKDMEITRDFRIIYHKDKYHSLIFTHFMDFLDNYHK